MLRTIWTNQKQKVDWWTKNAELEEPHTRIQPLSFVDVRTSKRLSQMLQFRKLVCDMEKEMATHTRVLAWRISGTEEPGGLPSMGSHRVGHNWSNLACMHALEKEMATHSSVLAWRIPGTEKPGGLPSMGLHRVGHNWSDLVAAAAVCDRIKTRIFFFFPLLQDAYIRDRSLFFFFLLLQDAHIKALITFSLI